jgi:hypothetical protein
LLVSVTNEVASPSYFQQFSDITFMPNGSDKNWIRLRVTANGFFCRHGQWPSEIYVPEDCYRNFEEALFMPETWAKVQAKIRVIPSDLLFVATNKQGGRFTYGERSGTGYELGQDFEEWIGLRPDHPHAYDD